MNPARPPRSSVSGRPQAAGARCGTNSRAAIGLRIVAVALVLAAVWQSMVSSAPSQAPTAPTLRVFTTRAIRTVLDRIGQEFERSRNIRLDITTDIAAPMVRRVRNGEPFDVLVAAPDQISGLVQDGWILSETRVDLARSGIGVAVRSGAAVPDVSTVEAFTRTLRNARSIAYLKEGQSGVYLTRLFEDLSLAAEIAPKVVRPERDIVSELVAQGSVEIGMVVVTQILTTPGVTLAGPLPNEIQHYVVFSAGVSSKSARRQAAASLLDFLTSAPARAVMQSQGMEALAPARR